MSLSVPQNENLMEFGQLTPHSNHNDKFGSFVITLSSSTSVSMVELSSWPIPVDTAKNILNDTPEATPTKIHSGNLSSKACSRSLFGGSTSSALNGTPAPSRKRAHITNRTTVMRKKQRDSDVINAGVSHGVRMIKKKKAGNSKSSKVLDKFRQTHPFWKDVKYMVKRSSDEAAELDSDIQCAGGSEDNEVSGKIFKSKVLKKLTVCSDDDAQANTEKPEVLSCIDNGPNDCSPVGQGASFEGAPKPKLFSLFCKQDSVKPIIPEANIHGLQVDGSQNGLPRSSPSARKPTSVVAVVSPFPATPSDGVTSAKSPSMVKRPISEAPVTVSQSLSGKAITFRSRASKKETPGLEQQIIDVGQKALGATSCSTCGMVYSVGDPLDEAEHLKFHHGFSLMLKFPGGHNERIVGKDDNGCIVVVANGDSKWCLRKRDEVLQVVDRNLGFSVQGLRNPANTKVYLFIVDKQIVSCLVAEEIQEAYRVIPQTERMTRSPSKSNKENCSTAKPNPGWISQYCSDIAEPVKLGISRIWTSAGYRRRGIATRLVNCMRMNYFYGVYLLDDDFAFSCPTVDGMRFATDYCRSDSFLVYIQ